MENLIGLPHYEIIDIEEQAGELRIWAPFPETRSAITAFHLPVAPGRPAATGKTGRKPQFLGH